MKRNPYESGNTFGYAQEPREVTITAQLEQEKKRMAVALGYDPEETAPKIIATGQGVLADRIIDKAKEHQIPVHRDDRLANTLSRLEVGDFIPPELYEVVAEVLLFVDRLDRVKKKVSEETF